MKDLRLQQREFFDETQDQDCKKYSDIFVDDFLFVGLDFHQYLYVDQDHTQYEIFLVLCVF
jgi:hypothetical protein